MKHNFRELLIWKRSMSFACDIYKLTPKLPSHEKFGLTSQINRASVSIPSNIAEGSARKSDKDFSKFLDYSLGSSFETETQIIIAKTNYPELKEEIELLISRLHEIQRMIIGFQSGLDKT